MDTHTQILNEKLGLDGVNAKQLVHQVLFDVLCPAGRGWTVRNFGVNSYNSLFEAKYLQKLLIEEDEQPDVIVFMDGDGADDSCSVSSPQRRGGLGLMLPALALAAATLARRRRFS